MLAFRISLREYQQWSASQAREAGLSAGQHQLLIAVKGHPGPAWPTVGEIAAYLLLRPHSAVELVGRAEQAGLVRRRADQADARAVRVELTVRGDRLVTELAQVHLAELRKLAAVLTGLSAEWPHQPVG